MMRLTMIRGILLPAALLALAATRGGAAFHTRLVRSEPMADSSVTRAPERVRLVFSQGVQSRLTTVRLTAENDSTPVALGEAAASERNTTIDFPVRGTLHDGRWQVAWRTMSADGHAVRGTFSFTLATTPRTGE